MAQQPEQALGILAFNASCGWDPVTGLGTPDFESLLKDLSAIAMNLKEDCMSDLNEEVKLS